MLTSYTASEEEDIPYLLYHWATVVEHLGGERGSLRSSYMINIYF